MPAPITFPPGGTSFAFLVSEANGYRSREEGVMAAASGISPGGMVCFQNPDGTYRPWAPGDTNAALLLEDVDATTAAVKRTFVVRDAEVQRAALSFAGAPTNVQKNDAYVLLAARGIALR